MPVGVVVGLWAVSLLFSGGSGSIAPSSQIEDYFTSLAESVDVPLIVQDASSYVGKSISTSFCRSAKYFLRSNGIRFLKKRVLGAAFTIGAKIFLNSLAALTLQ